MSTRKTTKRKAGARAKQPKKRRATHKPGRSSDVGGKRKLGRRTILTTQLRDQLVKVISAGNYDETAIAHCGISKGSFYSWLKRGEDELERLLKLEAEGISDSEPDPNEIIFLDFLYAIKKARADAEMHAVKTVRSHFGRNWQAAMTFLERRFPDRWRKAERHEHTGAGGGPIMARVIVLPDNGRGDRQPDEDYGGESHTRRE